MNAFLISLMQYRCLLKRNCCIIRRRYSPLSLCLELVATLASWTGLPPLDRDTAVSYSRNYCQLFYRKCIYHFLLRNVVHLNQDRANLSYLSYELESASKSYSLVRCWPAYIL